MRSDSLQAIADGLVSNLDPGILVGKLVDALVSDAGAAACHIWLRGAGDRCDSCDQTDGCRDRRECFHLAASSDAASAHVAAPERHPIGAGPMGLIARTGVALVSNDPTNDARFPQEHKGWLTVAGAKSCAVLPLSCKDETIGILAVLCRNRLGDREIHEAGRFARYVASLLANARQVDELKRQSAHLRNESLYLQEEILALLPFEQMVGTSPAIRNLRERIDAAAGHRSPALIVGPRGSWKELVARTIHARGPGATYPLIRVPCAQLAETTIESELFGHEDKAFPSTSGSRAGRLELAAEGSLFFDQVDRMPLELQEKLHQVIQSGRFCRVGGAGETLTARARMMASSARDLAEAVDNGEFHRGLYADFSKCVLKVPALKDRPEDVPLLIEHAIQRCCRRYRKKFERVDPETMARLTHYSWPGNIRELAQMIERAVLACTGDTFTADCSSLIAGTVSEPGPGGETLADVERAHIMRVLCRTGGVIQGPDGAAKILGVHPSTLRSRMARLGIPRGPR